jgi:fumarate reductase subunit C
MKMRKPYIRKFEKTWWLGQPRFMLYMLRELTCLFLCAYSIVILIGLLRLSQGRGPYEAFLEALQSPLAIFFHLLALIFALFHTVTWFGLTPKAMPLRLGENPVPGMAIIMVHYIGWLIVSAGILWMVGV